AVHAAAEGDEHGLHVAEPRVERVLPPVRRFRASCPCRHSSQSSSSCGATSSSSGDRPTTSRSAPHSGQLMISPLSTSYSSSSISASHSGQTAMRAPPNDLIIVNTVLFSQGGTQTSFFGLRL